MSTALTPLDVSPEDPKYDALKEFFGTYFYQYWKKYSPDGTYQSVVHLYAGENPTELVALACEGLDEILASTLDEAGLRAIVVEKLGAQIVPPNYREWLASVKQLLRDHLATGS